MAPAVSHATDFTVTNVADSNVSGSGTLRRAILDANAHSGADRVLFASGVSGTIHLSSTLGSLTIADPLEILGPGADQLAVHGDGSHTIFVVDTSTGSASISGLTLVGGKTSGLSYGGAIYANHGSLTVANSTFLDNSANYGGAVFSRTPTTISGSTFTANQGQYGGAIDVVNPATLAISGSTFTLNSAYDGGAIKSRSPATVTGSTLSGNTASYGGGIDTSGDLTLNGSTIKNGGGTGYGGGIRSVGNSALTLNDSSVVANSAYRGGGIEGFGKSTTISGSTIAGNSATYFGGATISSRSATISGSTFAGNHAYYNAGLSLSFADSSDSAPTVSNTTVSGNTADASVGGIRIASFSSSGPTTRYASLDSVTVTGNSAPTGGGIYATAGIGGGSGNSAGPSLRNSIVAGNTGGDLALASGAPSDPFNAAFSLIGSAPSGSFTSSPSNLVGVDPQLGPLASNGGPTQTQAPAPSSPAIDKGSTALTTDQRGLGRPVDQASIPNAGGGNGADMGAVELSALPVAPFVAASPPAPAHLVTGAVKFGPNGASITLDCSVAECDGVASLTTTEKLQGSKVLSLARRKKRTRRKTVVVGAKGFAIPAGRRVTLTVPLNTKGKALLKRFGKLPVSLSVTVNQGGRAVTIKTAKSVVTAHKKRKHHH